MHSQSKQDSPLVGKPTPGPWKVSDSKTRIIAGQFTIFLGASLGAFPEEWHANAYLIAASPDLFEACKWAARSAHHPTCPIATGKGQTQMNRDDCTCHVKAARAAIAKVEGRDP